MTEHVKTILANTTKVTKKSIWKYFGAMFMEKKDGEQAVSLTRLLSLLCFGMLAWKWGGFTGQVSPDVLAALEAAKVDVPFALKQATEVPETLMWTFWGLLGGKTMESMVALWKDNKGK